MVAIAAAKIVVPGRGASGDLLWRLVTLSTSFGPSSSCTHPAPGCMTLADSHAHPDADVEQLLSGLAGVISARVVSNANGRLDEIHVLASDRLHPKQIVRNVESALS